MIYFKYSKGKEKRKMYKIQIDDKVTNYALSERDMAKALKRIAKYVKKCGMKNLTITRVIEKNN